MEMDAAAGAAGRLGQPSVLDAAQFKPQYAQATEMKEAVQAVLSPAGKVAVMPAENRLIVADSPFNLSLAARVVQQLDVPRAQVRITALIYDLSLQDLEQLGVNWNHAVKLRQDAAGDPQSVFSGATLLESIPAAGSPSGAMTLMNLSRHVDLTAVVQALSQAHNSQLLADPNVTVVENEPATISIVTEIPYQQLTQTQQGGNIGTTAFREAGVKLEVVPQIAEDGTIQMTVTPSFSRLTGYTPGDQPQPIIDRREAQTTVRVANGQTLVIGGLRQRQEITEQNGIPFLKDIKYVGALFRSKNTTVRESELVVFIRPEIVSCFACLRPREGAANQWIEHSLDTIPPAPTPSIPIAPSCVEEIEPPAIIPEAAPQLPPQAAVECLPALERPAPRPAQSIPPPTRLPRPNEAAPRAPLPKAAQAETPTRLPALNAPPR
jgi:general secretion pathway protein D